MGKNKIMYAVCSSCGEKILPSKKVKSLDSKPNPDDLRIARIMIAIVNHDCGEGSRGRKEVIIIRKKKE